MAGTLTNLWSIDDGFNLEINVDIAICTDGFYANLWRTSFVSVDWNLLYKQPYSLFFHSLNTHSLFQSTAHAAAEHLIIGLPSPNSTASVEHLLTVKL